ncbi:MAG: cyclic nucleotide-binding domain-containing protein [Nitrospirae bacterium]|nr:cyclic nucleotide-binding domain-containing protein [Nitrospirota bacterium]
MEKLSPSILKLYSYFSHLSDGALEEVCDKLEVVELPAGSGIIEEGAAADSFFMIKRGAVDVLKKTKWGQDAKITSLKCGEGFGEMALLTCSHRYSTVIAKTDVTLYKLYKKDFDEIVRWDSAISCMMGSKAHASSEYNKIKTLQPFALLDPEKMFALSDKFVEKNYAFGSDIIKEGEVGDAYYVIKSGKVAVIKKENREQPEQVAVLSEGEGFGEEALISGKRRSATCRAMEETVVLSLSKADFEKLMKASFLEIVYPEDITPEDMKDIVFIDTRFPKQFEEEHIEGAVNMPLEYLRTRYTELDPAKKYYTYCGMEAWGMPAAFILKSLGLDASGIRGGLSAWEGPVDGTKDGIHLPEAPAPDK